MDNENTIPVEKFDNAEVRMSGRGIRAIVENIDAFFSADPSTEEGSAESVVRLEAVMLMFDDILYGCGVEAGLGGDDEGRDTNPFYQPVIIG